MDNQTGIKNVLYLIKTYHLNMKKLRIALGFIVSDLGGIAAASVPLVVFLSFTNFFVDTSGIQPVMAIFLILVLLSFFILPFRLLLIGVEMLRIELDKYGRFSMVIIGGLTAGSLFYFLVLSRLSLDWLNIFDYALIGVMQSIIVQVIYNIIPQSWKVQPAE